MKLLSNILSVLSLTASGAYANSLYSFKCATYTYLCGGVTKDTSCDNAGTNNNGVYIVATPDQCKGMIAATTTSNTYTYKCPNNRAISHYVKYGCGETFGKKYEPSKNGEQCTCSAGYCGVKGPCGGGSGSGDPHFLTHDGTKYDFHGECDLVMARSSELASGFNLDVHTRTKMIGDWSLISNAAVRIGNDIFEVADDGLCYLNGMEVVDFPIMLEGTHEITKKVTILQNDSKNTEDRYQTFYKVRIEENQYIMIMRFRDMITIRVDAILPDTVGMLGTPTMSGLVGRDGQAVFTDPNDMGLEWQVRDTEPMLFREVRAPQYPQTCVLPATSSRRKLRHSDQTLKEAKEACASVNNDFRDSCIDDVLTTGNKYIANAYTGF